MWTSIVLPSIMLFMFCFGLALVTMAGRILHRSVLSGWYFPLVFFCFASPAMRVGCKVGLSLEAGWYLLSAERALA